MFIKSYTHPSLSGKGRKLMGHGGSTRDPAPPAHLLNVSRYRAHSWGENEHMRVQSRPMDARMT